jgi:ankyrin repeat protein
MRSATCLVACLLIAVPALAAAAGADAADAAQRNDLAALRAMVARRVNVNAAQPDGTTALHWAAHWNDVETVKLLLRAGANPAATTGSAPRRSRKLPRRAMPIWSRRCSTRVRMRKRCRRLMARPCS